MKLATTVFHYLESSRSDKDEPVNGFGEINCWLKTHLSALECFLPTEQAKNLLEEMEQNDESTNLISYFSIIWVSIITFNNIDFNKNIRFMFFTSIEL